MEQQHRAGLADVAQVVGRVDEDQLLAAQLGLFGQRQDRLGQWLAETLERQRVERQQQRCQRQVGDHQPHRQEPGRPTPPPRAACPRALEPGGHQPHAAQADEEQHPVRRKGGAQWHHRQKRPDGPEPGLATAPHERRQNGRGDDHRGSRQPAERPMALGRQDHPDLGRQRRQLAGEVERRALHQTGRELQRLARRIDVQPRARGAKPEAPVDRRPGRQHHGARRQRQQSAAPRARLQRHGVGNQVGDGPQPHLARRQGQGQPERRQQRRAPTAIAAPAVVGQETEKPEEGRHQRVAVRQPARRRAVRLVHGVEQRCQPGDPAGAVDPAVEERRRGHHGAQPEQAVGVLQRRRLRPQPVVEPVGRGTQIAEERQPELGRGPPGEETEIDVLAEHLRAVAHHREELQLGVTGLDVAAQHHPVEVVVGLPTGAQRRQTERHRQRRQVER